MEAPNPGEVFEHFKGRRYIVGGIAKHTGNDDLLVIYMAQNTPNNAPDLWARPLAEWSEPVKWPDGAMRPRFVKVDGK